MPGLKSLRGTTQVRLAGSGDLAGYPVNGWLVNGIVIDEEPVNTVYAQIEVLPGTQSSGHYRLQIPRRPESQ